MTTLSNGYLPRVFDNNLRFDEFDYGQFDKSPETANSDEIEQRAKTYAAQLLAWVFGRLQSCRTTKSANIDRDALIFALGMATLEGRTQTEIADSYGITKAAFSAHVKSWQKLLGLKPSSFMKSEQACKAYRNARLRNLTRQH